jgi:transcriptional regulator with XRE-family HTH domain
MNYQKIRQRREELNFTQEYVANKLGISQNMYSMLESGRSQMKVDQLILVAQVLEADPNEFLQQESVVFNMDNAKIENGSGGAFYNSSFVNQHDTNHEIAELLKKLTELLVTISSKLKNDGTD